MDPITQTLNLPALMEYLARVQGGASPGGGYLPGAAANPMLAAPLASAPPRPAMGGYMPDPAMPQSAAAPPMKPTAPVTVPPPAPGGRAAGVSSAPPSPGAAPPAGLLAPPQPLSPMVGAPQAISPLLGGGALPALPAGGLPSGQAQQNAGGGFLDWLGKPEVSRGLMEMGARMLAASAPSTDPRSGSLGFALGQGVGGFSSGMDQAREQKRQERNDQINEAYKMAIMAGDGTPTLQRFYDDQGRETYGYWDAGAGRMIQVGGSKAPTGKGGGGGTGGAGAGGGSPTTLSGSLTTKDKQIINSIPSLRGAVDAYEAALNATPVSWWDRLASGATGVTGPELTKLEALRTQVIMQLKELQGLGAPQAGDLALLAAQLSDPTSLWALGRGPEGFKEQLSAIRTLSDTIANSYGVGGGGAPSAPAPGGGAPMPGVSEDGYRFLGGDPSDPANWEPE